MIKNEVKIGQTLIAVDGFTERAGIVESFETARFGTTAILKMIDDGEIKHVSSIWPAGESGRKIGFHPATAIETARAIEEAARKEFEAKTKVGAYTIAEMRKAFDAAEAPDWKDPIASHFVEKMSDARLLEAALAFFHGAEAKIAEKQGGGYLVYSPGYQG